MGPFWTPILLHFGSILGSSKMSCFSGFFLFLLIFGKSGFWRVLRVFGGVKNGTVFGSDFAPFLGPFLGPFLEAFFELLKISAGIIHHIMKVPQKGPPKVGSKWAPFWAPFWLHFGLIFGPPKNLQNPQKWGFLACVRFYGVS